jgi:cytochrome c peroxidase
LRETPPFGIIAKGHTFNKGADVKTMVPWSRLSQLGLKVGLSILMVFALWGCTQGNSPSVPKNEASPAAGKATTEAEATPEEGATAEAETTPEADATPEAKATKEAEGTPEEGATAEAETTPEADATPEAKATKEAKATPEKKATAKSKATPEEEATTESEATPEMESTSEVSPTTSGAGAKPSWTAKEKAILKTLVLASLSTPEPDPSNAFADNPKATALGQKLYFDERFSSNGKVACATCHKPELSFTDGMSLSHGVGVTGRNAPSIIGNAYSPWMFWDGRKDSVWAQALGPLESAVEHGGSRTQYAHLIATNYKPAYEAVFGKLPDLSNAKRFPPKAGPVEDKEAKAAWGKMTAEDQDTINRIFANMGKAIAAAERPVVPMTATFDTYVAAVLAGDSKAMAKVYTPDQEAGLRVYIGKGKCLGCHTGPLFTNNTFQNIGVQNMIPHAVMKAMQGTPMPGMPKDGKPMAGMPKDGTPMPGMPKNGTPMPGMPMPGMSTDDGRASGVDKVLADEFNCLGKYSDAKNPEDCKVKALEASKALTATMIEQFRTMTLRNIAETAPYMHDGKMQTLEEVVEHYDLGFKGNPLTPPLGLTKEEKAQLVAFMKTLSGPIAGDLTAAKEPTP